MEIKENLFQADTLIENVTFKIAEKTEDLKQRVMALLHEYPNHFVPGLFEAAAEQDFGASDIMTAVQGDTIVGCLMFNRVTNEFNWLAVSKEIKGPKSGIAKQLFENFYPTIEPGTTVRMFPNTEDSFIPGVESFSGANFEAARNLYRSMGFELTEENIIRDHYGEGGHVYKVEWKIGEDKK